MKILRVLLLASAFGAGGISAVEAQQPASPEAVAVAKELIAIMSPDMMRDMNTKMFAQMWPPMEQALRTQFPQIDAAGLTELSNEIRAEMENQVVTEVSALMDTMPAVYARYLTVEEMRDIQAFYRTPSGAKALKVMPEIMGETMAGFAPRMQAMGQRINTAVVGILQKHGYGPK